MNLVARELAQTGTNRGSTAPEVRVFHLTIDVANTAAKPADYPVAIEAAGCTLLFDPEGATTPCDVLVAFDTRELDIDNYITLRPGVTHDVRPASFNRLFLRVLARYTDTQSAVFVGKLIVAPSLTVDGAGASPATPIYTRPVPSTLSMGTALNADRNAPANNWSTVGGATGIFTNRCTFAALSGSSGTRWTITNIGPGSVYLAVSALLSDGTLTAQTGATYELQPGKTITVEARATVNTPRAPVGGTVQALSVYSGDATAAISWVQEDIS